MKISSEVLIRLVLDLLREHAHGREDLTKSDVVWDLLLRRFPDIDGVIMPPRREDIQRIYLADFINLTAKGSYHPSAAPPNGPEFRQSLEHNAVLRIAAHAAAPPTPTIGSQILNAMEVLSGDDMASLALVITMAMGREQQEAMRIAKLLSSIQADHGISVVHAPKEKPAQKLPQPYTPDEIRSRLSRGYRGGV